MPQKAREIIAELERAGFKDRGGKGSHRNMLSLTHDASGKVFKTAITLTEEESALLSRMSNDVERQAFINGLPVAQAALQQLAS